MLSEDNSETEATGEFSDMEQLEQTVEGMDIVEDEQHQVLVLVLQ